MFQDDASAKATRSHQLKTISCAIVPHDPATRGRGSGSISREMATALLSMVGSALEDGACWQD